MLALLSSVALRIWLSTVSNSELFYFLYTPIVLIDKDRNPKWQPSTLSEVSDEYVNSFFKPAKLPDFKELQL